MRIFQIPNLKSRLKSTVNPKFEELRKLLLVWQGIVERR